MAETATSMPEEGKKAPEFSLPSMGGEKLGLKKFKGQYVVLYFYPKDDTPGCTTEAKEFRDAADQFGEANTVVLGVSPDSIEKHCKFRDKHELNFELLADEEHAVAEKYGVWVEKSMYGKKYWGVQRATFLIGPDGKVAKVWPKVKPQGHAKAVLEAIHELAG